jgi:hypothetical protein
MVAIRESGLDKGSCTFAQTRIGKEKQIAARVSAMAIIRNRRWAILGQQATQRASRLLPVHRIGRLAYDFVNRIADERVGRHALGMRQSNELGFLLPLQGQNDSRMSILSLITLRLQRDPTSGAGIDSHT